MSPVRILWLILALWAPLAATAGDSASDQLRHFLSDVRGFDATFEQQLFDERGASVETAKGKVSIARPGRFDWDYQTPYQQRIVSDGKTLWIYDADLAQVTVNPVTPGATDSPARLLGDDFDLDTHFTVTDLPPEQAVSWLALAPKTPRQQFTEIKIGFQKGELVVMRLKDNLGQTTEIRFSAIARNPAVSPARFKFEPPAGVDVIHGTGG